MSRAATLLALVTLAACASSSSIQWAAPSEFALVIADNPTASRFDITLRSHTRKPLCLSKESWPGESGLPLGFDGARLRMSKGTLELRPTGSAYCPDGCGQVRLESGQSLSGTLPYAAFGEPAEIEADPQRVLLFDVHPFACSD